MTQTNRNFGRTFVLTTKSDGQPVDLSSKTLLMQFKRQRGAAAALEASTENGKLTVGGDPSRGRLTLQLTFGDVKGLDPGNYFFDLAWVVDDDNQHVLFGGVLSLSPGITSDATAALPALTGSGAGDIVVTVADEEDDLAVIIDGGIPGPQFAPTERTVSSTDIAPAVVKADNLGTIYARATGAAIRIVFDPTAFDQTMEINFALTNDSVYPLFVSDGVADFCVLQEPGKPVLVMSNGATLSLPGVSGAVRSPIPA